MDEVRDIKTKCINSPEAFLWRTTTAAVEPVKQIFYSIQKLAYADRPDYEFIRQQLLQLLQTEEEKEVHGDNKGASAVRKEKDDF